MASFCVLLFQTGGVGVGALLFMALLTARAMMMLTERVLLHHDAAREHQISSQRAVMPRAAIRCNAAARLRPTDVDACAGVHGS